MTVSFQVYLFTAENTESAEMTARENLDQITASIIAAAIEVHRALGPCFLESVYEACLTFGPTRPEGGTTEPPARGLSGSQAGLWHRLGLLVEEAVIVEVMPIHQAQLLSYLVSIQP